MSSPKAKLLIIGHTFPEPATTAAGQRMMQLIAQFQAGGFTVTFASTAIASERSVNLQRLGITAVAIQLNDPSFDAFLTELQPNVVLFDRFITEEQFGWRVAEVCKNALRVLDTEDLHFLRKARQEAVLKGFPTSEADLFSETAKRELASILRCDLSLIISEVEIQLLEEKFKIPKTLLWYLPFLVTPPSEENKKENLTFDERDDFITVGNLLHAPNIDSVRQLKKVIWPRIRMQLPDAQLRVYGAYAPQQIKEFHNQHEGFLVVGWTSDLKQVMQKAKVCLAPIRFGAGLKGKLLDAMMHGTPSVTTPIGAEGMCGSLAFGGIVARSDEDFVETSVALYNQNKLWNKARLNGYQLIEERFAMRNFSKEFIQTIHQLTAELKNHREAHFIGQILHHHTLQSTKYLSKWIEQKNAHSSI